MKTRKLITSGCAAICLDILLLTACGNPSTLLTNPTPISTPSAVLTPIPPETITVMTYNILNGGGTGPTDPNGPWCCGPPRGCCNAGGGDRLPRILEVIRAVDPDILGIQEACLWQLDDEVIARQAADELGMNYALGQSADPNGGHVALFTKFEIKSAENYPCCFNDINPRGALHAEVVTPNGQLLHIFVVHLKTRVEDVAVLLEKMAPYLESDTILMGDMNFQPFSGSARMLSDAGWVNPVTGLETFDHIWISPSLAPYVWPAPKIPSELTSGTSDHLPFVVTIGLYPP